MEKSQQCIDRLKKEIEDSFRVKDIPPEDALWGLERMRSCMKDNDLEGVRYGGEKVIQSLKKVEGVNMSVSADIYKDISLMCWGESLPKKQEGARKDVTPQAEAQRKKEMPPGKTQRIIKVESCSGMNKPSQDRKEVNRLAATFHGTGETHPSTSQNDAPEDLDGYKKVVECKEKMIKDQVEKMERMEKISNDRAKELEEKEEKIKILEGNLEKQTNMIHEKQTTIIALEKNLNDSYSENQDNLQKIEELNGITERLSKDASELWGENSTQKQVIEHMKREQKDAEYRHESKVRKLMGDISSLTAQRDDLRDRFSKVAGAKLTDNNADIADLSDPNRAMKLAERFAALYDDEWTDAFQEQKDKIKKKSDKEVVQNLLQVLVECFQFCQRIADQQMDVLNNVLLHPCQDASLDRNISGVQKGFNQPRVHSKDVKIMKEARRKIATEAINEVKEQFISRMRQDPKTDKKAMECSLTYYEKCAEICWHMVLHDPVLHLKLDVKEGDKMDLNLFTTYQSSGTVIEYLVWPPLLNGKDGGLLNKGVAQPTKNSGKPSKK